MMPARGDKWYAEISMSAGQGPSHPSLRAFRNALEAMFRECTLLENRSFLNLYGRMEFVFESRHTDASIRQQLHALRRYTRPTGTLALEPDADDWLLSLRAICEAVAYLYDTPVPEPLALQYRSLGTRRLRPEKPREEAKVETLQVLATEPPSALQTIDGQTSFTVRCREEALGELQLTLTDQGACLLSYLQPLLQPFQQFLVTHCQRLGSAGNHYQSTPQSLVILEPDLLMDVSDLANCFEGKEGNPALFFAAHLVPQPSSLPAFLGTLVNSVLDESIRHPGGSIQSATQAALREHFTQALTVGQARLAPLLTRIEAVHGPRLRAVTDRLQGQLVRIEPSFLSARWGLQGRLDLLVEDPQDPLRKDIFELKSGNAPNNGRCKMEHGMQVVGYNMLLESVFGPQRSGTSAVIYSGADRQVERNVAISPSVRARLLRLRNEVVSGILRLADGDAGPLETLLTLDTTRLQRFHKERIDAFQAAFREADPRKKAYYLALLSFLLREYLDMKCGRSLSPGRQEERNGFAALWREPIEEKCVQFSALAGLRFLALDADTARVHFHIPQPREHNFRSGDLVVIHGLQRGQSNPLHQQLVKARIEEMDADTLCVALQNRQLDASHFTRYPEWAVEHDGNEKSKWKAAQQLFAVVSNATKGRFERLVGLQRPNVGIPPDIDPTGLNENQAALLRSALAAKDYYLVQGPPGTGKTSTFLTSLVASQLNMPGSMAVVAFTNRAVEEIAARLEARQIPFMRLGSRFQDTGLQSFIDCLDVEGARRYLRSHRVFLSTVATLTTQLDNLRQLKADLHTLIVDEASQLDEAQLAGMLLAFDKYILIGDQNQLPPIITQDASCCTVHDPLLTDIDIRTLTASVFERLMRNATEKGWAEAYGMLDTQYRMHESIAALINPWYGHRLRSGFERQAAPGSGWKGRTLPGGSPWQAVLEAGRTVFVPSPRAETPKYHVAEATRIAALLQYMQQSLGDDFSSADIGVVTPWRTQISKIREHLSQTPGLETLAIDTVERFQGSEKDIILASFAVCHPTQMSVLRTPGSYRHSNPEGSIREINLDRKLLVTLSRARHQIILFGEEEVLASDPVWAAVLSGLTRCPLPPGL